MEVKYIIMLFPNVWNLSFLTFRMLVFFGNVTTI